MSRKSSNKTDGYRVVRYFTPSSITASQATKTLVRARKLQMTQPLTYQRLLDDQTRKIQLENLNSQTAANRATALRGFLNANHLQMEDIVGAEMRVRYPEAIERYIVQMQEEGRPQRSISNTRSTMRPWKDAVVEFDTVEALSSGNATPFMQAIKSVIEDRPVKRIAKEAGIPLDMLWGWLKGKIPRASSARYILRLESYFGIERNTLVALSGMKTIGHRASVGEKPTPREYNEILGRMTKSPFCLKPSEDSPLRKQWQEFLKYKTAAAPTLKRTKRGKWRFSPCPLTPETAPNWWSFLDGKEVASSRIGWIKTSGYLGWLGLPAEQGGQAINEEQLHTLAWLVVPDFLEAYMDWMRGRAGKRNQGQNQFLAFVTSLVRPRFGYLRQRPELHATLPIEYQNFSWDDLCNRQFDLAEQLVSSFKDEIEVSRNPFDPIRHLIELSQPMDALADMVQRMRGDRPIGQPKREAVWGRDLFLVKLLISNPLRRRNFAHLTWRADNTGQLYQRVDKSWWIRIHKTKFKNTNGAAGDKEYDCQVNPAVWRDLERYLFIYRPVLLRAPTDLVFLALNSPRGQVEHRPWADISKRVEILTAMYLPSCAGFGMHSFRHLVTTSILKADGGDFKTAAGILNDRVETVERHYSSFLSNDAAENMARLLKNQFSRM